jgi:hypothetical protein
MKHKYYRSLIILGFAFLFCSLESSAKSPEQIFNSVSRSVVLVEILLIPLFSPGVQVSA